MSNLLILKEDTVPLQGVTHFRHHALEMKKTTIYLKQKSPELLLSLGPQVYQVVSPIAFLDLERTTGHGD